MVAIGADQARLVSGEIPPDLARLKCPVSYGIGSVEPKLTNCGGATTTRAGDTPGAASAAVGAGSRLADSMTGVDDLTSSMSVRDRLQAATMIGQLLDSIHAGTAATSATRTACMAEGLIGVADGLIL